MWKPSNEDELIRALELGEVKESNSIEFKREIGDTPGARAETAKDLSSFAIDGGVIVIGVQEDKKAGTFSAYPIKLAEAVERIEQVAQSRVDPPLNVRVTPIASARDNNLGYLYVEVPPSPDAPHMVGGIYYARGDRTTRRMADAEVVRMHLARRDQSERIRDLLGKEILRDPIPEGALGHLFLVALPLLAHAGMAADLVWNRPADLYKLIRRAETGLPGGLGEWAPNFQWASRTIATPHGTSQSSFYPSRGGSLTADEGGSIDIEVREGGEVIMFAGRATDFIDGASQQVLMDSLIISNAYKFVRVAKEISDVTGYRGPWSFAISATRLRGLRPYMQNSMFSTGSTWADDDFQATATARYGELEADDAAVVVRLVGRLIRGLGRVPGFKDILPL